jgi:hypothetical protein
MNEDVRSAARASIRYDTGAWFSTFGRIWPKDRSQGLQRPNPNFLQVLIQEVIDKMESLGLPIRIIGLKPRQKGSTTYFSAIDYTFLRRQSAAAVVIGGQYSQTTQIWEMMKTYCTNDGFNWGNTGEINAKEGRWSNGSRLVPETANDKLAGISGTFQILHATEVARWNKYGVANAAEVLTNILKSVPLLPDTVVILESTAEGNSGEFHDRFITAVDSADFLIGAVELQPGQYVRVFAPWLEFEDSAVRLTDAQKAEMERTLDAESEWEGERELMELYGVVGQDGVTRLGTSVKGFDVWEQLAWRRLAIHEECERDKDIFDRDYPHSWRVAFMKSGDRRFNGTGLGVLRKRLVKNVPIHGLIEEDKGRLSWRPTDNNEAKFTLFEKPLAGRKYLVCVDVMTGETQTGSEDPDYNSAFCLRAGYWNDYGKWVRPATAARIVSNRWDVDVLEGSVWRLAKYYGGTIGCKIIIEMNMDRGMTEYLKARGADLYAREIFNRREFKTTSALGFQTNQKTREMIIDLLARAIREWDKPGEGLDVWCEHAIEQLENFVRKGNGRSEAAEGYHDDDVLSIALGLQVIEQATTYFPERFGNIVPPDLRGEEGKAQMPGAYT